ncbi:HIT domain-containing protein [Streptomyces sp. Je 1-4]|uniref:HIT family protein n=1 Tax=Streptomyces TaxID=1883 RepID=UPI00140EDAE7|nr:MULTISPECIES: HIT domain-containing protein [unclassified Streptomyces]QIK10678.1 HIT domain-containing protein [Streptomyces sp. ID38640]UYB44492.1 HIT domain-containing protein [Streptomyces sp. Je 1-4]UZQ40952.1 HIT domain-containing protein [Streptomyces sp. Je 1-4] [Streptomyces sp. Je 1-4 4N24]UZQ48369.1 HIT domain-containing protein [Streptomyces sp. Je 1-4] [Streptomyces sp. Je 1-4 4N24_ara]
MVSYGEFREVAGEAPDTGQQRPRTPRRPGCPFCLIVWGRAPATVLRAWPETIAIRPRHGGVTAGHVLVIPRVHVADVAEDPVVSAATMLRAAELAAEAGDCNVITSRGPAATQTVRHLHLHLVPRAEGDGLLLPWSAVRPTGT